MEAEGCCIDPQRWRSVVNNVYDMRNLSLEKWTREMDGRARAAR